MPHDCARQIAAIIRQRLIVLDAEKLVEFVNFSKSTRRGMLYSRFESLRCIVLNDDERNIRTASRHCRVRCARQLENDGSTDINQPEERNFLAARSQSIRQSVLGISARSQAFA